LNGSDGVGDGVSASVAIMVGYTHAHAQHSLEPSDESERRALALSANVVASAHHCAHVRVRGSCRQTHSAPLALTLTATCSLSIGCAIVVPSSSVCRDRDHTCHHRVTHLLSLQCEDAADHNARNTELEIAQRLALRRDIAIATTPNRDRAMRSQIRARTHLHIVDDMNALERA
jgi:hypothetical protein